MAERHQFASPIVGGGAGFDSDKAGTDRLKEGQHLAPSELPPNDDSTVSGYSVYLENVLRQIEPDDSDGLHDTAPRRDVPDDDCSRKAG